MIGTWYKKIPANLLKQVEYWGIHSSILYTLRIWKYKYVQYIGIYNIQEKCYVYNMKLNHRK